MLEDDAAPESVREVAAEDFLFHLYRGNELLQDDRVHEAKQELEHALALQPRDAKGQDLLAIVYFRLGLYPRAISIYERLLSAFPDALTPRINLALCYLKTGQPSAARVELEHVLAKEPGHARAWGYLGLAFQRLGDTERAVASFHSGGHHGMAQRLAELSQPGAEPTGRLSEPDRQEVGKAAAQAFDEIDRGDAPPFHREVSQRRSGPSTGTWAEPGLDGRHGLERRASAPSTLIPSLAPSDSLPPPGTSTTRPSVRPATSVPISQVPPAHVAMVGSATPTVPPSMWAAPISLSAFASSQLMAFPDRQASQHESGCVVVQSKSFAAVRLDSVRAMTFTRGISTSPVLRRTRGRPGEESLGGVGAPLLQVEGAAEIVLGAPPGSRLLLVELADEPLTVRENVVIALIGDISHESARLPGTDGDSVPLVQMRGPGAVALAFPAQCVALELFEERALMSKVFAVLGWTGRVSPRAVPPSEAPTKARGMVALGGQGTVFLDGR